MEPRPIGRAEALMISRSYFCSFKDCIGWIICNNFLCFNFRQAFQNAIHAFESNILFLVILFGKRCRQEICEIFEFRMDYAKRRLKSAYGPPRWGSHIPDVHRNMLIDNGNIARGSRKDISD